MERKNSLTLIGVPIGNIEDISLRVIKALFSSDVILAEDTRNYLKIKSILKERYSPLLSNLEVNPEARPELVSYREQNHERIIKKIIDLVSENKKVSFVSDAGMPAISDPGFRLVDEILKKGFNVEVIPGPTAVDTALVVSGLPTDRFVFLGFLSRQAGKIKKTIQPYVELDTTIIIYESPYRVIKTLEIIKEVSDEFTVAACNDLTKKFEKVVRGKIVDVIDELKKSKIQGEWVIAIRKL